MNSESTLIGYSFTSTYFISSLFWSLLAFMSSRELKCVPNIKDKTIHFGDRDKKFQMNCYRKLRAMINLRYRLQWKFESYSSLSLMFLCSLKFDSRCRYTEVELNFFFVVYNLSMHCFCSPLKLCRSSLWTHVHSFCHTWFLRLCMSYCHRQKYKFACSQKNDCNYRQVWNVFGMLTTIIA